MNSANAEPNMEQKVIGGILIVPHMLGIVRNDLCDQDFTDSKARAAFSAITRVHDRGMTPDVATVFDQIQQDGAENLFGTERGKYLIACMQAAASTAKNVVDHASVVRRMSLTRKLREAAEAMSLATESAGTALPYLAHEQFTAMEPIVRGLQERSDKSEMQAVYQRVLGRITGDIKDDSVIPLDSATMSKMFAGGLRRTELVVLAGRTSQGKTALTTTMLRSVAVDSQLPCVIYTYEMSAEEIINRIVSEQSGVALECIMAGDIKAEHLETRAIDALAIIAQSPLEVVEASGWTIDEIAADVHRRNRKAPLAVVAIDYLQLVDIPESLRKESRSTQVGEITKAAKRLAQQANVVVLAPSQLNRHVEIRTGIPQLSDLRESGSIEQDANKVLFIYDAPKEQQTHKDYKKKILDLQKNRNGPTCHYPIYYRSSTTHFVDWPSPVATEASHGEF